MNRIARCIRPSALVALATVLAVPAALGAETPDGPDPVRTSSAEASASGQQLSVPDWMQVDHDAQTVTMEIVAGLTDENNSWNFNGYTNGEAHIVVPEGYEIEIEFRNDDPNMAHSLGIGEARSTWPAMIPNPQPVFEGAMSRSPTAMARATQPGASETITFTAGEAGEYAMVCYIPGHAAIGMWTYFDVSADGEAGVREG